MIKYDFNKEKNELLKNLRGVSFEDVIETLEMDEPINIINHPNQDKYPEQKIFLVEINKYMYVVPFIKKREIIFLKTIYPSRKASKKFLNIGEKNE